MNTKYDEMRSAPHHLPGVHLGDDSLDCSPVVQAFQVNKEQAACKLYLRDRDDELRWWFSGCFLAERF